MLNVQSYLEQRGWRGRRSRDAIIGCCPLHEEEHSSFAIYHEGQTFCCYHEHLQGDVIALINYLEGDGQDTQASWRKSYAIARELSGGTLPTDRPLVPIARQAKEERRPTELQRAVMTAAMQWYHTCLFERAGLRGRHYLDRERGIVPENLRLLVQVGYVPSVRGTDLFASFDAYLSHEVDPRWKPTAIALGLLSEKYLDRFALWDRIICFSINHEGEAVSFQARQVHLAGEPDPAFPYLLNKAVRKEPFHIPVASRMCEVLTHVESPFGVLALAPWGLPAIGWHGGPHRIDEVLAGLPYRRHIVATDHDTPRQMPDGRLFQPGEVHAQKLLMALSHQGEQAIRFLPLQAQKDLDTMLKQQGGFATYLAFLHEQQCL